MFTMNGIEWKIKYVKPNDRNLMRSDGSQTFGVTDNNKKMVYLSSALSGDFLYKVLCHELCHCAAFSYGYDMDIQTEEIVADFISLYGHKVIEVADSLLGHYMGYAI